MNSFYLKKYSAYLRYIDVYNKRPAIVFLHGLGSSSIADFSKVVMSNLSKGKRCLLPDFLGHGFSDKPGKFNYTLYDHAETIALLLDYLKINNAIIIGHSMGGTVAIALTQKHPDLVRKLILLEPNLYPGIGGGSRIIAAQTESNYVSFGHDKYLKSLKESSGNSRSLSDYAACFSVAHPAAIYRSAVGLLKGTNPEQKEILKDLSIPKYYINGDENIDEVHDSELKEMGLERIVIRRAGHAMMHDNLKGLLKALEKII